MMIESLDILVSGGVEVDGRKELAERNYLLELEIRCKVCGEIIWKSWYKVVGRELSVIESLWQFLIRLCISSLI